jgi:hypothetical protein
MGPSENNGLILVKREITEGTDPVPTAAINAVAAFGGIAPTVDGARIARRFLTGDLSRYAHRVGRKLTTLSITFDFIGSGTAAVLPRFLPLLEMCALKYAAVSPTTTDINAGATYKWTVSGSGTDEYYVDLLGGGNPTLTQPSYVTLGSPATRRNRGALGSLALGEWGYGDNDSLGFSTVYVRLDDGADPDSKATGWVNHVTASSHTLKPRSSGFDAATVYSFLGDAAEGLRHRLTNAFGNWQMTFDPVNGTATVQIDIQSLYNTPTDVVTPAGTFDTPLTPLAAGLTLDFDAAWTPVVPSVVLNGGVTVVERPDLNAANGLKGLKIVAREVSGTIITEQENRAIYDLWAKWEAGTEADVDFQLGSAGGNTFAFDFPKAQLDAPRHGTLNGYRTYELPFFANRTSGDDEMTMTIS